MRHTLICIFGLFVCGLLPAQNRPALIQAEVSSTLFTPYLSRMVFQCPLDRITALPVLSNMDVEVWYLTNTGYFWPGTLVEGGATLRYGFTSDPHPLFTLGLGAAVEQMGGVWAVPFLVQLDWVIGGGKPLVYLAGIDTYVLGQGIILDASTGPEIRFGPSVPVSLALKLWAGAAAEFSILNPSYDLGLRLSAGYRF